MTLMTTATPVNAAIWGTTRAGQLSHACQKAVALQLVGPANIRLTATRVRNALNFQANQKPATQFVVRRCLAQEQHVPIPVSDSAYALAARDWPFVEQQDQGDETDGLRGNGGQTPALDAIKRLDPFDELRHGKRAQE